MPKIWIIGDPNNGQFVIPDFKKLRQMNKYYNLSSTATDSADKPNQTSMLTALISSYLCSIYLALCLYLPSWVMIDLCIPYRVFSYVNQIRINF